MVPSWVRSMNVCVCVARSAEQQLQQLVEAGPGYRLAMSSCTLLHPLARTPVITPNRTEPSPSTF